MRQVDRKKFLYTYNLSSFVLSILLMLVTMTVSARPLVVGSLSDTPSEEITVFLPFATYLAAELGDLGIDGAEVRVSREYNEMAELMKQGKVDLFIDSSMSALIVQRLSGGDFLVRRWKKGISEYHSVLFVRAESPVRELADLVGHSIAFEEPFSSSGYLLPASEIRQAGLTLVEFGTGQTDAAVSYRFSHGDENTLLWVLHGRMDAGAMSANTFAKLSAPQVEDLRVIHQSISIPYHLVVHRPGLSDALRQALHKRLLDMENNPSGQGVLTAFEKTTRFDDVPADVLLKLRGLSVDLPGQP